MSGSRAPHLQCRNGAFHVRVRVPGDVRGRLGIGEVCRSLGSCSFGKASALASIYAGRLKEAFVVIMQKQLDKEAARELVRVCFHDLVSETEVLGGFVPETDAPDLEIATQREASLDRIVSLRGQVADRKFDGSVRRLAENCIRGSYGDVSEASILDVMEGIARALIEQQNLFLLRLHDRLGEFSPADLMFASQTHAVKLTAQAGTVQLTSLGSMMETKVAKGPTVGDAIASYLAHGAKRWASKTHAARVRQLGYLEEALGSDTPLAAVSSHHIRNYRDAVTSLRANHGRAQPQSFAERQTESGKHQLTPKSASLIFEPCKAFFAWATNDEGLIESNPAQNVRITVAKLPEDAETRRPFSQSELLTLFSSPVHRGSRSRHRRYEPGSYRVQDAKFWIPILGFYTGARLGEIAQLHIDDIRLDGPIPFISINKKSTGKSETDRKQVKTPAGIRNIPLHPDVLALGFAAFFVGRAKAKQVRLFPEVPYGSDGQASTVISKWFARFSDKVGLSDPTLCFHSFRHNAEDAFRNAKLPAYVIDKIIGHSDGSTSSQYGEGIDLETAYDAVLAMKLLVRVPQILQE